MLVLEKFSKIQEKKYRKHKCFILSIMHSLCHPYYGFLVLTGVFVLLCRDFINSLRLYRSFYGGLADQLCVNELAAASRLPCWNGEDLVQRYSVSPNLWTANHLFPFFLSSPDSWIDYFPCLPSFPSLLLLSLPFSLSLLKTDCVLK